MPIVEKPLSLENEDFQSVRLKRAESPKAPSPGQRPGLNGMEAMRPVRAKALYIWTNFMLLPLQGDILTSFYPGRCPGLGASALSGRIGW